MGAVLPTHLDAVRLDELLSLWARWMRSSQPFRELWYPDQAAGCVGGGNSTSFEEMVEIAELRQAEAVNGAIDSLQPNEQSAIYHFHLAAVYRMWELEDVYLAARATLSVVLPQRGIY